MTLLAHVDDVSVGCEIARDGISCFGVSGWRRGHWDTCLLLVRIDDISMGRDVT